jgi:hypothetical protein
VRRLLKHDTHHEDEADDERGQPTHYYLHGNRIVVCRIQSNGIIRGNGANPA